MQKLYIDGEAVEMGGEVSGFQFVSEVEGLDKKHASRTETIKIPMTPHNMRAFNFPNRPDQWGGGVRIDHVAQLVYAGGVVSGTFKVTDVTPTEVTGTMIYAASPALLNGELCQPLKEVISPTNYIELKESTTQANVAWDLNMPLYWNGANSLPIYGIRLPAVRVSLLVSQLQGKLGFNVSAALQTRINAYRIILNTMNAAATAVVQGAITVDYSTSPVYAMPAGMSGYFTEDQIISQTDEGERTRVIRVLKCLQKCRLRIMGTNARGYTSITTLEAKLKASKKSIGWSVFEGSIWGKVNTYSDLKAVEVVRDIMQATSVDVEMEPGQALGFLDITSGLGHEYTFYTGDLYPAATFLVTVGGLSGSMERTQVGGVWTYGNYYLNANLPQITGKELLNVVAIASGKLLTFDDATNTFDLFDYDFDAAGGDVISLDKIAAVTTKLERRALDFGQVHRSGLKLSENTGYGYTPHDKDCAQKFYVTSNKTIAESTEQLAPVVEAAPSRPYSSNIAIYLPCGTLDEGGAPQLQGISAPVLVNDVVYQGTMATAIPTACHYNEHLQNICNLSTVIEVNVPMRLFEFMKIKTTTRFTYMGGWWFCRSGQYQKGNVRLKLQRYK